MNSLRTETHSTQKKVEVQKLTSTSSIKLPRIPIKAKLQESIPKQEKTPISNTIRINSSANPLKATTELLLLQETTTRWHRPAIKSQSLRNSSNQMRSSTELVTSTVMWAVRKDLCSSRTHRNSTCLMNLCKEMSRFDKRI